MAKGVSAMTWGISMLHDLRFAAYTASLIACLALLPGLTSISAAQELDGVPEHVVKVALNPNSEVVYSGIMRKQLMAMGDSAAVAVTRVLAGNRPGAEAINRVLLILEFSFDSPEEIVNQADQKPKTALFVLAFLDQQALSNEQKKHLGQLRTKLE